MADIGPVADREFDGAQEVLLDSALSGFILLSKFLGVPADPDQLTHERGRGSAAWTL